MLFSGQFGSRPFDGGVTPMRQPVPGLDFPRGTPGAGIPGISPAMQGLGGFQQQIPGQGIPVQYPMPQYPSYNPGLLSQLAQRMAGYQYGGGNQLMLPQRFTGAIARQRGK